MRIGFRHALLANRQQQVILGVIGYRLGWSPDFPNCKDKHDKADAIQHRCEDMRCDHVDRVDDQLAEALEFAASPVRQVDGITRQVVRPSDQVYGFAGGAPGPARRQSRPRSGGGMSTRKAQPSKPQGRSSSCLRSS